MKIEGLKRPSSNRASLNHLIRSTIQPRGGLATFVPMDIRFFMMHDYEVSTLRFSFHFEQQITELSLVESCTIIYRSVYINNIYQRRAVEYLHKIWYVIQANPKSTARPIPSDENQRLTREYYICILYFKTCTLLCTSLSLFYCTVYTCN